jgi:hypothetical protein
LFKIINDNLAKGISNMKDPNTMNGTPGAIGAAVVGSAFAKGLPNTDEYLTKTVPARLDSMTGFDQIRQFHAYVFVLGMVFAGYYWALTGDFTVPGWIASLGIIWVPLGMLLPAILSVLWLVMGHRHARVKTMARFYAPGGDLWLTCGETGTSKISPLIGLMKVLWYFTVYLPIIVIQDTVEIIRCIATGGKHKFRTSEARYFEKQRQHYNAIMVESGVNAAEDYLRRTSAGIHTRYDEDDITMKAWVGGRRSQTIAPLEAKYGPLVQGRMVPATWNTQRQTGAVSPNDKSKKDANRIVVKPIKGL